MLLLDLGSDLKHEMKNEVMCEATKLLGTPAAWEHWLPTSPLCQHSTDPFLLYPTGGNSEFLLWDKTSHSYQGTIYFCFQFISSVMHEVVFRFWVIFGIQCYRTVSGWHGADVCTSV